MGCRNNYVNKFFLISRLLDYISSLNFTVMNFEPCHLIWELPVWGVGNITDLWFKKKIKNSDFSAEIKTKSEMH